MRKRKICIITGTRAEYGLLYWLMQEIQCDESLEFQLIATGMHLSPEFGLTYKIIEEDGFAIDEKVEMLMSSDTPVGISKSMGLGVIGFADALARLKPDIVVVLGDRYEILAAVQAALVANLPIAHIHGGELTEGAIDDSIRHAITKMSHLHFVSAEPYRKRVIQLGENPERVFNFGAPGMDHINKLNLLSLDELEEATGFPLGKKFFLVTYHPVTTELEHIETAARNLLLALELFPEYTVLFTKPNSDTGGRIIGQMIDQYVKKNPERIFVAISLGQLKYLSAMRLCSVVVGNSSSGISEAPALLKPSVNIGNRQKGRIRSQTIIDCGETVGEIAMGIREAISCDYKRKIDLMRKVGAPEDISKQIKEVLKTVNLQIISKKKFYDL